MARRDPLVRAYSSPPLGISFCPYLLSIACPRRLPGVSRASINVLPSECSDPPLRPRGSSCTVGQPVQETGTLPCQPRNGFRPSHHTASAPSHRESHVSNPFLSSRRHNELPSRQKSKTQRGKIPNSKSPRSPRPPDESLKLLEVVRFLRLRRRPIRPMREHEFCAGRLLDLDRVPLVRVFGHLCE